jgi:hypothetical protein
MKARMSLGLIGWLIRDTFRQTYAEGVAQLALLVSAAAILGCLTVSVTPVGREGSRPRQEVRALFGQVQFEVEGDRAAAARMTHASLAMVGADSVGVLLLLLWTAAVLPAFLEPEAVTVLIAKPVPRWSLLAGKCLGVLACVSVQALVFVVGTAVALGWRVGWEPAYLLALLVVMVQFVIFFSFSAMLAVATRSTVASFFGTIVFWLLCWAMNAGRHALHSLPDLQAAGRSLGGSVELGYWVLPRPLDLHLLLAEALGAPSTVGGVVNLPVLVEHGLWRPSLSVVASLLFAGVLYVIAAYDFLTADY